MKVLLVGNQNSGKSSLFNLLTGDHQTIGNYAGVTVEEKIGYLFSSHVEIIDLPGLYSLFPYSKEEKITRNYLFYQDYDLIVNVVDVMSLRRGLFLTIQLKRLQKPMIVLFNFYDEIEKTNSFVDVKKIESRLQIKIIPFSVKNKLGLEELKKILFLQKNHLIKPNIPPFEDFPEIEKTYQFLDEVIIENVKFHPQRKLTDQLDRWFLHPFFSLFFFFIILFVIYFLTIDVAGKTLGYFMEEGIDSSLLFLESQLKRKQVSPLLNSLLCNGILKGIGAVLKFIPQLFVLFFFIGFLEDCGYMARIAMIFDHIFQRFGLSGKSIISFILGSGCSIPAMMSTRSIENERSRKMTIILTPFIPCSAKLPVMILFSSFFFQKKAALVCVSLYILSILIILCMAFLIQRLFKHPHNEIIFFDLPTYRMPSIFYLFRDSIEKVGSFIKKAGTILFLSSFVVWILLSFDCSFTYGCLLEDSILAQIGKKIDWLFYPFLGEKSWPATISALQGLLAREQIISSMQIIASFDANKMTIFSSKYFSFFTPVSAYSYMIFCLFSAPCMGAIQAMNKELQSKKITFFALCMQTVFAYFLATLFYQLATWINSL